MTNVAPQERLPAGCVWSSVRALALNYESCWIGRSVADLAPANPRARRAKVEAKELSTPRSVASAEGENQTRRPSMGRSILLWLVGVPIPVIILLALFWR